MTQPDSFFARSVAIIRRHFLTLWFAAAWPILIVAASCIVLGWSMHSHQGSAPYDPVTEWRAMSPLAKLGVVIAWVLSISLPGGLAVATVTAYVWDASQEATASLGKAFRRLGQVLTRLLTLALLVGFCSQMGLFFFALPGVAIYALFSFSIPVLVIEDASAGDAIRRGMKLGAKRVGALLGIFFGAAVFALPAIFITIALSATGDFSWAEQMCVMWGSFILTFSLVMMTTATLVTELYRVVREQETQAGTLAAGA